MEKIKENLSYLNGFCTDSTFKEETGKYEVATAQMNLRFYDKEYTIQLKRESILKPLSELLFPTTSIDGPGELFSSFEALIEGDEEVWAFVCKKYLELEEIENVD